MVGAYANAVQDAANNANGAANGFYGVGMMNMASGGMIGGTAQGVFQGQGVSAQSPVDPFAKPEAPVAAVAATPAVEGTPCSKCGTPVVGNFCTECGTPKNAPVEEPKAEEPAAAPANKCPECGAEVTGKFCTECGTEIK
jgi:DNA-directed RNA polymerase subunit RPC12/RpoP